MQCYKINQTKKNNTTKWNGTLVLICKYHSKNKSKPDGQANNGKYV